MFIKELLVGTTMKCFALVNAGLEKVARQEIEETVKVKSQLSDNVVEFETEDKAHLLSLKIQSARRLLISLGKTKNIDDFKFGEVGWQDILTKDFSFRVEVEGVKGQENRIEISRAVAGKFFKAVEDEGIQPKIELKTPQLLLVVYFNQTEYFLGIDSNVEELNSRNYRVFAHQASFKGDLAYYFVRRSCFRPGERLLVGFAKDGTIAIEAARFAGDTRILSFDESRQNVTAARKNAKLAKVDKLTDIQKYSLDELDVKFSEGEFDRAIFHVTTKDEEKINEIYYQLNYILKHGGTVLFIGRKNWELSISSKFILKEESEICKGESCYKTWLLEKKKGRVV